ncbi:hypothetical protein AAG906_002073 [Vitis piasezkii]
MEHFGLRMEKNPRDLLQRLMGNSGEQSQYASMVKGEDDPEEIELNLGLSLGGRFGVDKSEKKLMRSSSIAGSIGITRDEDALVTPAVSYSSLMRTSSLPTETQEEWRKRKELQTLRRMEAKRRRSEKQRNKEGCVEDEKRDLDSPIVGFRSNIEKAHHYVAANRSAAAFGFPTWAAAAAAAKGKGSGSLQNFVQQTSQGSAESQGGSSSSMSELESKPLQGYSSCGEARSLACNQSLQEQSIQEASGSSRTKPNEGTGRTSGAEMENPSKNPGLSENRGRGSGMNFMGDMPCVFTRGDGPNGRRIEGILYKYGKGEEVRIMCVCHGSFLSPAEFVKHAGGGDVAHPLRHIVVNPSSASFV